MNGWKPNTSQSGGILTAEERISTLERRVDELTCLLLSAPRTDASKEIDNLAAYRKARSAGVDALCAFYRSGGWLPPKALRDRQEVL
jgi:hypothetical protein